MVAVVMSLIVSVVMPVTVVVIPGVAVPVLVTVFPLGIAAKRRAIAEEVRIVAANAAAAEVVLTVLAAVKIAPIDAAPAERVFIKIAAGQVAAAGIAAELDRSVQRIAGISRRRRTRAFHGVDCRPGRVGPRRVEVAIDEVGRVVARRQVGVRRDRRASAGGKIAGREVRYAATDIAPRRVAQTVAAAEAAARVF